ncbi:hypothetical protein ABES96_23620 [Bacillus nitratireducens]|uniref:hypothetical protein n=1 Tax=Bacillus nitratireducens TaxID=2026193 RepID=UPI000BF40E9D|nr:hypothetical protein CN467_14210 [Bacillus cereus]PFS16469.1 hypothetical protein COK55_06920 [Bacillus cereus]
MNLQQMNGFLNSKVGKRLIKQAQDEEKVFQDHMQAQANKIAEVKDSYNFMFNGTASNSERIMDFDGTLVHITTGNRSKIESATPITNESYKALPNEMKVQIKAMDSIKSLKLEMGQSNDKLSDRAFNLLEASERYPFDVVQALASAPQGDDRNKSNYRENAWEYYSTPENRTNGITKQAEELVQAFSDENLIDINRKLISMENEYAEAMESGSISEFVDHFGGETE